jgi:hypothetical protein
MATAPEQVRIRSYNVGFGDAFLLMFSYPNGDAKHVLIDFGSSERSDFTPDRGLLAIAEQIKEDCGEKLDIVVATHRHSDHVSGFARRPGAVIRSLQPELVIQPWTEQPGLDPNARAPARAGGGAPGVQSRALVARLSEMHAFARAVLDELPRLEAAPEVPKAVTDQLRFLGDTNLSNKAAVRNLATMGVRNPVYARFGTRLRTADILPGVKIDVIGPPTLEQSPGIAREARVHDEFWQLAAARARAARRRDGRLFPGAATAARRPQEARAVIPKIDSMHAEEMLALVRSLDDVLNNTSLILVFEFGRQRLVFPGDAQIENWSHALFEARNSAAIRARLRNATFYKVGHHGSLNATPKTLWNAFSKRSETAGPDRLRTMVSTLAGKHGDPLRGTEVPRSKLVDALCQLSEFNTTEAIKTVTPFWVDVVLPP